ncbi:MAG: AEC family transporter [Oscillospiraceae bacterium]|nr:AEC family transporter [Oscillospiraceae bacterium]MCD8342808.1 AEC family transporter [Oscillospiraceae bacterium]MCD8375249.1 AEC family transporter [Oscillospiraceae bacterium]
MTVFHLSIKLIMFISIGYIGRKVKALPDGFDKMLTKFLLAIPIPAMIIHSFFNVEFSMEQLVTCPEVIGLAVLTLAIAFAIAFLCGRFVKGPAKKPARYGLIFSNFTFFGMPLVNEIYGAVATFYYVIFCLPVRILFYGSAPVMLGASDKKVSARDTVKQFLCAPVYSVLIGLVLYITQIDLPATVSEVIESVGDMSAPLGMMLCGCIIADSKWSGILKYPCIFWLAAVKMLVIPAVMMGVMLLLGIEPLIIKSLTFYFCMPAASFLPAFCLRYDHENVEARTMGGFFVVLTTVLCIVIVPVWTLILERAC